MKKVKVNKSHKKADLSDVLLKFKRGAFIIAAGLNMAVFLEGSAMNPQEVAIVEESVDKANEKDDLEIAQLPENPGIDLEDLLKKINHERKKQGLPVLENKDQITIGDLKNNLRLLNIRYSEGTDLSWLRSCKNLEKIAMRISGSKVNIDSSLFTNNPEILVSIDECDSNTDLRWMEEFKEQITKLSINIKDDRKGWTNNQKYIIGLTNLESLIVNDYTELSVNETDFGSIKDIKTLQSFEFIKNQDNKYGYGNIDPQLFYDISNMPNMKSLGLPRQLFSKLDYTEFGTKNKKLCILYMTGQIGPGDIAISLTQEELDYLENNGISFLYDQDLLRVKEINEKISKIIEEINFRKDMTDEEKRNEIVKYLCINLQYDPEFLRLQEFLGDDYYRRTDIQKRQKEKFYKDGYLYGVLESNTQICGNYAALFNAIAERVGLESYIIISDQHAYNLVNISGKYILVDPTWVDNEDEVMHYIPELDEYQTISVVDEIDKYPEAAKKEIKWLHKDISTLNIKDENDSHYSLNIPENIQHAIEEIKDKDEDNYDILSMPEKIIYSMAGTIAILLAYAHAHEKKAQKGQGEIKNTNGDSENEIFR